jgi:ATP-dependent RNA helicase DeaD
MPVPGGQEICERQLFSLINRMTCAEVNHEQIDPYMGSVYEMLNELSKEELIKRFVSLEFNRFLNYYKNAVDLTVKQGLQSLRSLSVSKMKVPVLKVPAMEVLVTKGMIHHHAGGEIVTSQ